MRNERDHKGFEKIDKGRISKDQQGSAMIRKNHVGPLRIEQDWIGLDRIVKDLH